MLAVLNDHLQYRWQEQYTLKQGCYADRFCKGNFSIQSISAPRAAPSKVPVSVPTAVSSFTVTEAPPSELASVAPTVISNVISCPFSAAAFTGYGYNVYRAGVPCTFSVCPGMQYAIADLDPSRCLSTSHGRDGGDGKWSSVTELIGIAGSLCHLSVLQQVQDSLSELLQLLRLQRLQDIHSLYGLWVVCLFRSVYHSRHIFTYCRSCHPTL